MARIGRIIYLETSAIWAAGWPRLSVSIERFGQLARLLEAEVFVPELVEIELEERWLRDFTNKRQAVTSRVKEFERFLSEVVERSVAMEAPDRNGALEGYRRAAKAVREKLDARSAPVTGRPVKDFGVMAARRNVPLKDRDEGFRDAVIFWSIIDHAVALGRTNCILIAQDGNFSKPEMIAAAKEAGVTLHVYKKIQEFIDDEQGRFKAAIRRSLEQDQERARNALLRIRENVETFIAENLVFHEHDLALFIGVFRGISRVAVTDIRNVRTSVDVLSPTTETEIKISFEAAVDVHIVVERYPIPAPRAVRVGEELQPAEVGMLEAVFAGPQRFKEVRPKVVEMEAIAARTGSGDYEQVRLEAARLQRGFESLGQ